MPTKDQEFRDMRDWLDANTEKIEAKDIIRSPIAVLRDRNALREAEAARLRTVIELEETRRMLAERDAELDRVRAERDALAAKLVLSAEGPIDAEGRK